MVFCFLLFAFINVPQVRDQSCVAVFASSAAISPTRAPTPAPFPTQYQISFLNDIYPYLHHKNNLVYKDIWGVIKTMGMHVI
jgi:hypothetical protein